MRTGGCSCRLLLCGKAAGCGTRTADLLLDDRVPHRSEEADAEALPVAPDDRCIRLDRTAAENELGAAVQRGRRFDHGAAARQVEKPGDMLPSAAMNENRKGYGSALCAPTLRSARRVRECGSPHHHRASLRRNRLKSA